MQQSSHQLSPFHAETVSLNQSKALQLKLYCYKMFSHMPIHAYENVPSAKHVHHCDATELFFTTPCMTKAHIKVFK